MVTNNEVKTRGDVAPDKIQTNMRLYKRCYTALQADADRRGFASAPALLNHILTVLYFGTEDEKLNLIRGR
jgi:hypothetical protein